MTNKEYHIVRGIPSEEFQNTIDKSWTDAKLLLLTHIYMTTHFPGLVETLH
jgi:hypothetical protein